MTSRQGYRVVDRAALAEIVARIVEASGGQANAAGVLKIGQPQISKMLRQRVGGLSDRTFQQLLRRCPADLSARLQAAVLDPAAVQAIRHYQSWLLAQLAEYGLQANEPIVATFHRPQDAVQMTAAVALVATGTLPPDLNPPWPTRADQFVAVMLENHDYKKILHDFMGRVGRRLGSSPETSIRIRLSLCRAVAPLLAGRETDQIERTAEELHGPTRRRPTRERHKRSRRERQTELGAYLKHALAAEEILLRRAPYFSRAQRAAGTPAGANRMVAERL